MLTSFPAMKSGTDMIARLVEQIKEGKGGGGMKDREGSEGGERLLRKVASARAWSPHRAPWAGVSWDAGVPPSLIERPAC